MGTESHEVARKHGAMLNLGGEGLVGWDGSVRVAVNLEKTGHSSLSPATDMPIFWGSFSNYLGVNLPPPLPKLLF